MLRRPLGVELGNSWHILGMGRTRNVPQVEHGNCVAAIWLTCDQAFFSGGGGGGGKGKVWQRKGRRGSKKDNNELLPVVSDNLLVEICWVTPKH